MRHLLAVATIAVAGVLVPVALSTPGGLDSRSGHHCWTRCSSYGKYRGQYHCHRAPCSIADIRRHRAHGH
jgi:hypothetical protein